MNGTNLGWLKLRNRYAIQGTLIAEGAMHVGSGYTGEVDKQATDAALLRDQKGLLIPGSSLRGAMRSIAERILQSLNGRGCVLFVEGSHPDCLSAKDRKTQRETEAKPEKDLVAYLLGDGLCDICKLFGSPWLASKLRVSDCRPPENARTYVRHGVGIDLDTGTARDQIKYDFEVMEKTNLSFGIEVENAGEEDLAIVGILLRQMQQQGIVVGGKGSRGLGRLKLELNNEIAYFDTHPGSKYGLTDFLLEGKLGAMPKADFEAILDTAILNYLEVKDATATAQ